MRSPQSLTAPTQPLAGALSLTLGVLGALGALGCAPKPSADLSATLNPASPAAVEPVAPGESPNPARWRDLSIEADFGCAVEHSGGVYCWGRGPAAALELRELPPVPAPKAQTMPSFALGNYDSGRKWGPASRLEFIEDARAISTASAWACAIVGEGGVRCWGGARWGTPLVYDLPNVTHAVDLSISNEESCVLEQGGLLSCWGPDDGGLPRIRLTDAVAMTVSIDDSVSCGLSAGSELRCWGSGVTRFHEYAVRFAQPQPQPQPSIAPSPPPEDEAPPHPDSFSVGRFPGVVDIAVTHQGQLCLLHADGELACSTNDIYGPLRGESLAFGTLLSGVEALSASRSHTCARTQDGRAQCWGSNTYGQLGDQSTSAREAPAPVVGLDGVLELSVSEEHSCAATEAGELRCWGFDRAEAIAREDLRVHTLEDLRATSLAANSHTTCALDANQRMRCWGTDMTAQVGSLAAATPRETGVDVGSELHAILAGWQACYLGSSETLQCGSWMAAVGAGGLAPQPFSPELSIPDTKAFSAGPMPSCAIVGGGRKAKLRCGNDPSSLSPGPSVRSPTAVSTSNMRACVLYEGGKVGCLGHGYSSTPLASPPALTKIPGLRDIVELASANYHDCARARGGQLYCWPGVIESEWNESSATVVGTHYRGATPQLIEIDDAAQIVAQGGSACALRRTGDVRCWADIPHNDQIQWLETPLLEDVVELAAGTNHTCARHKDGRVTCWGDDLNGQLGRLPSRVYLEPTALPVR